MVDCPLTSQITTEYELIVSYKNCFDVGFAKDFLPCDPPLFVCDMGVYKGTSQDLE